MSEYPEGVVPSGLIKNPKIVMLPDGPDHKNWIEVGDKEKRGLKIAIISYAPKFGHLWRSGWISEEEIEKAKQGKKFQWLSSQISGHAIP